MNIFKSLESARQHGFHWMEFHAGTGLHLVVKDYARPDGRRSRVLAFAQPDPEPEGEAQAV